MFLAALDLLGGITSWIGVFEPPLFFPTIEHQASTPNPIQLLSTSLILQLVVRNDFAIFVWTLFSLDVLKHTTAAVVS